ncbi:MAG: hypothetical protein DBP02_07580 [gamma proteobacterium symbiont of Ctena orbiculata]|nr:MAG: hypothetical protein DBP02_07580 [gamma proteobacterium symbiont of Ctena orbiculata]
MRSVHLERDIQDPSSSLGYILTPVAEQALERITKGFKRKSTQRAWRLTGDYGSGKTDFGLVLARAAKGARRELPKDLRRFASRNAFLPVIATGDSEALGSTVLRALDQAPESRHKRPSTDDVLKAVRDTVVKAKRKRFGGLLLILDELGKNLEHISRNPDSDDIFLLQRLAEEAARSGDKPFVIVVMLHQGVAAYAANLDTASRREWDKVAGRFEEIVYAQPVEQTAALVAATLNVDTDRLPNTIRRESETCMVAALKAGLYGSSAGSSVKELGSQIFPLHPTVLPVLVRVMRRFGQNERSLFSFISSAEPMGLQYHASRALVTMGHYRIHHLFDYVRSTLLPVVTTSSANTHWGIIDTVLASAKVHSHEEEAILKTVGLLNLLDAPDLPATEKNIRLAVGGEHKLVDKAIVSLRDRGIIYERGSVNGLFLWPHTSVNLDEVFEDALEATAECGDRIELVCNHIESERLVPRAYYVQTGTLRFAEVQLIPANLLDKMLTNQPVLDGKGADLNIRIVLPLDKAQKRNAERVLRKRGCELNDGLIVAVAGPPSHAVVALRDLVAWKWVKSNTPKLSGDHYAREEVARQISRAAKNLRTSLGGLDNLAVPNAVPLLWFSNAISKRLHPGRQLLSFLGEECSRIYRKAPKVLNELINRRQPSAAAVAARTKIAEAMATSPHLENLGMDDSKRPAELALYLSVVRNGGFHILDEDGGGWVFRLPSRARDRCRLLPSINAITRLLTAGGDDVMVPVTEVFSELAKPPYGVREGLRPVILALYLATHHQRVALYEDGSYLPSVGGDEFHRLMKEPQAFQLQHCALEGVREDVFLKLLAILKYRPRDPNGADLLDLVRPLVVFIAQNVPEYARRTNNLPAQAVAVRRVLLESREPIRMVFTQLPQACCLNPVGKKKGGDVLDPKELAVRLKKSMHAIQTAYPELLKRIGNSLCAAFGITQGMPHGRKVISTRAAQLVPAVTEPTLKSFALRLADTKLDHTAWLESMGNLLARKSPERWRDLDETEFLHQLEISAGRFKRTEFTLVGTTKRLNGHACRIALTRSDGTEVGDLVDWNGLDESLLEEARGEIESVLDQLGPHGLAAAMEALWCRLDKKQPHKE